MTALRRDALAIPFWSPEEVHSATRQALAHLEMRRVLAYPTETVYGFGGAIDRDSVDALVNMKRRPPGKPFLLLIAGSDMLERLDVHLPSYAANLAARHWPGPLTLVLPGAERRVPDRLRGPEGGIAVRWTSHVGISRLIRAVHNRQIPLDQLHWVGSMGGTLGVHFRLARGAATGLRLQAALAIHGLFRAYLTDPVSDHGL